jgi:hypothetical protein
MAICQIPGCEEHYACRLRGKGLQVSPRAMSTRTQNWRPTKSVPPKSNGELVYQDRPGGTKMPVFNPDGTQLYKRDYVADKRRIDNTIRQIRNSGNP